MTTYMSCRTCKNQFIIIWKLHLLLAYFQAAGSDYSFLSKEKGNNESCKPQYQPLWKDKPIV